MFWKTVKFVNVIKLLFVMIIEIIFLIKCNYVYIVSHAYDLKPRNPSLSLSFSNTFAHILFLLSKRYNCLWNYFRLLGASLKLEFLAELWNATVAVGYELSLHLITGQWCLSPTATVDLSTLLTVKRQCRSKHLGKCVASLFSRAAQDFMF